MVRNCSSKFFFLCQLGWFGLLHYGWIVRVKFIWNRFSIACGGLFGTSGILVYLLLLTRELVFILIILFLSRFYGVMLVLEKLSTQGWLQNPKLAIMWVFVLLPSFLLVFLLSAFQRKNSKHYKLQGEIEEQHLCQFKETNHMFNPLVCHKLYLVLF